MRDTYLERLLSEDERILYVTRRHWLVLAGEILSETILSLALIVLVTLLIVLPPLANPLFALGFLLLVFPAVSLLRDVTIWMNRKFVVTNRRIIHVEGVFSKDVTDSSLEKVNDVQMQQSFLGRVFGYGDIEILTASELGASKFTRIGDPIRFKTEMLNAKHRLEHPQPVNAPAAPPVPAPPPPSLADRVYTASRQPVAAPAAPTAPTDPNRPAAASGAPGAPADIPAMLRQLDELRQAGVLTEAEFQNKKAQLLSRL